jgi:hypothetical protein
LEEAQVVAEELEAEMLNRLVVSANSNHPPLLHVHLRDKSLRRQEQHPVVVVRLLLRRHLARRMLGSMKDLVTLGEGRAVAEGLEAETLCDKSILQ